MSSDRARDGRPGGLIALTVIGDERGSLTVLDEQTLPFAVARVFLVYDVPDGELRGDHAHRECHQLLVCTSGSLRVSLDDGTAQWDVELTGPHAGLHIPPLVWASQHGFAPGTVLMVLASHPYAAAEYIRDRSEFASALGER
jgi:UDP-2-acetamido-3-amino-2,3-dideoxy-glucuronate N-acetyltransferase